MPRFNSSDGVSAQSPESVVADECVTNRGVGCCFDLYKGASARWDAVRTHHLPGDVKRAAPRGRVQRTDWGIIRRMLSDDHEVVEWMPGDVAERSLDVKVVGQLRLAPVCVRRQRKAHVCPKAEQGKKANEH